MILEHLYDLTERSDSTRTFETLSGWIRDCEALSDDPNKDGHFDCRLRNHSLPTRLVSLGTLETFWHYGTKPRLVLSELHEVEGDEYVALSHCWGYVPDTLIHTAC